MQSKAQNSSGDNALPAARQAVMALLARAGASELDGLLAQCAPLPAASDLRPPETGLVMLRGRTGGDGAPFNLGEATVSRAAVRLADGATGFAYRLGRDARAARMAAIVDALWQDAARRPTIDKALDGVRARLDAEATAVRAETAATKVDFFTLVRGED